MSAQVGSPPCALVEGGEARTAPAAVAGRGFERLGPDQFQRAGDGGAEVVLVQADPRRATSSSRSRSRSICSRRSSCRSRAASSSSLDGLLALGVEVGPVDARSSAVDVGVADALA